MSYISFLLFFFGFRLPFLLSIMLFSVSYLLLFMVGFLLICAPPLRSTPVVDVALLVYLLCLSPSLFLVWVSADFCGLWPLRPIAVGDVSPLVSHVFLLFIYWFQVFCSLPGYCFFCWPIFLPLWCPPSLSFLLCGLRLAVFFLAFFVWLTCFFYLADPFIRDLLFHVACVISSLFGVLCWRPTSSSNRCIFGVVSSISDSTLSFMIFCST